MRNGIPDMNHEAIDFSGNTAKELAMVVNPLAFPGIVVAIGALCVVTTGRERSTWNQCESTHNQPFHRVP